MLTILLVISVIRHETSALSVVSSLGNPLQIFGKCISDHECKATQFCDHSGINPIGSCRAGYNLGQSCHFDRHCATKYCHHLQCVPKKPLRDGPCQKGQHHECLLDQYCGKDLVCVDRQCSGWCTDRKFCMSNRCCMFRCARPAGEAAEQFCPKSGVATTTKKPLVRDGPCTNEKHDECLPDQYCSDSRHVCTDRKSEGPCLKHEHCLSNHCGITFLCRRKDADISRPLVRDGPCTNEKHSECLPDQYCSDSRHVCTDRKHEGACLKNEHCVSNHCGKSFRCKNVNGAEMTSGKVDEVSDTTKKGLVRDGVCANEKHDECLPDQYCSDSRHVCTDRKHEGACLKNEHCVSNHCGKSFRCKNKEN